MKIVCDSCGAKYSIADEKVAGKVFKIRCKKCSSTIVVRGDQVPNFEEEESTRVYDYGSEAIWHVVVGGDQQGPMAPAAIGQLLTEGSIDWDAYVWREGFEGWKTAREVPELVEAITAGGQAEPEGEPAGAGAAAASAGAGAAAAGVAAGAEGQEPAAEQPAAEQPAAEEPAAEQPAAEQPAAEEPAAASMGADPFAAAAEEPAAGEAEASPFGTGAAAGDVFGGGGVAQRSDQDAGADLFAQSSEAAASPFGAAPGGEEEDEDVVASSPAPAAAAAPPAGGGGGADSMTGQRNENSVLFSLSNLQALATGPGQEGGGGGAPAAAPTGGGGAAASAPAPAAGGGGGGGFGSSTTEGSGLIDIRALASATQATSGAAASKPKEGVDDLLSIGGASSSTGYGSPLGSPVLAPAAEPEKSNKNMIVAISAAAGVLVLGLIVALVVVLTGEPDQPQMAQAPMGAAPGAAPGAPSAPSADDTGTGEPSDGDEAAEAAAGDEEEAEAADEGDEQAAEEEKADEDESSSDRRRRRRRAARRRGSSGSSSSSKDTSKSSASSSGSSSKGSGGGGSGDIDSLLERALGGSGGGGGGGGGSRSTANLPTTPSRSQVGRALGARKAAVKRCGSGGVAMTRVTVSGSTGRVTNVNVTQAPSGADKGCIARAVKGARFPRFKRSSFSVTYPYRM